MGPRTRRCGGFVLHQLGKARTLFPRTFFSMGSRWELAKRETGKIQGSEMTQGWLLFESRWLDAVRDNAQVLWGPASGPFLPLQIQLFLLRAGLMMLETAGPSPYEESSLFFPPALLCVHSYQWMNLALGELLNKNTFWSSNSPFQTLCLQLLLQNID